MLSWIVYDGLTRFRFEQWLTDERKESWAAANIYFDKVSAGDIGIEQPETTVEDVAGNRPGGFESIDAERSPRRTATRNRMKGL